MSLEVSIREITPEEALQILDRNPDNRSVRQQRVQQYARDMKAGRWRIGAGALLFNGNGDLMDGQHRLLACVLAGKPFSTVVITGMTQADHATIDTGMTRTFSDELRWREESNVAELAAVCLLGWTYDNNQPGKAGKIGGSRIELLTWLNKNPDVRESVRAGRSVKELLMRTTAFTITHYIVVREHGPAVADAFLNHLMKGTDYAPGDPCLALRTYALTMSKSSTLRPSTVEWFAVCLKAANSFLTGRPIQRLHWRRLGPKRENFPALVSTTDAIDVLEDYADDLS